MTSRPGFSMPLKKHDGKVTVDKERFKRLLDRLGDGDYTLTVERFVKQRTLPQNAYLHAHPFPILARHFGCSINEVKRDLMGECFGWKTSPITGRPVPVKEHTADMNVEDANFFIDWLIPWAIVEQGVELHPPDKEWMFNAS